MSSGRCYGIIKYLMVSVNLLFFILSIGVVVLAIWMLADPSFYVSFTQDSENYQISTYIFLITGLLLLLVSFLGCCGACKESTCQLVSFCSLLLVIIVAQLATGIWCYTNSSSLDKYVGYAVKSVVREEYYTNSQSKAIFDDIQTQLECCGAVQPSDWISARKVNMTISSIMNNTYTIPVSCCRKNIDNSICLEKLSANIGDRIENSFIYDKGCIEKIINRLHNYMSIAYIVGLVVIFVELLGLTFAIILACGANKYSNLK